MFEVVLDETLLFLHCRTKINNNLKMVNCARENILAEPMVSLWCFTLQLIVSYKMGRRCLQSISVILLFCTAVRTRESVLPVIGKKNSEKIAEAKMAKKMHLLC